MPGLIVAAPRSGSGKTTVALGLMRSLARRGVSVHPFKCGPDYIDAAFHTAAAGRSSKNLDTWAMREELIAALIGDGAEQDGIAIAEGAMGLFDGVAERGQSGRGSTADLAAMTGWPAVLVLDVSGQTETAAAVALGCAGYRADVRVGGVILNRVASARHERLIVPAMERAGLAVLGVLGRRDDIALPERHLGLIQAAETAELLQRLDAIADFVEAGVRVDAVAALAAPAQLRSGPACKAVRPPGQRIALGQDEAFSFIYPHIVDGWREAGAEIVSFSPLADEAPDARADAVWLPGGYPELHAGRLASAQRFRTGLADCAQRGIPIHGECGGFMALGAGLVDANGGRHAMAGLLGVETSFAARKLHLGYRRARLLSDSVLGPAGTTLFGHEFHYASLATTGDDPFVEVLDANADPVTEAGARRGSVTGTFFHVIDGAA